MMARVRVTTEMRRPTTRIDGGRDTAGAGDVAAVGGFGFVCEPTAEDERDAGQCGGEVILLARGEAEEEQDDDGPDEEEEQGGFVRCAHVGGAQEAQADLADALGGGTNSKA